MNNNDYKTGSLPQWAPLASAYVPVQRAAQPAYEVNEALARGTLFPGLDLPLMGMENGTVGEDDLSEYRALCFAAHELQLYLDTHRDDRDAFESLKALLALKNAAKEKYVKAHGAVCPDDLINAKSYCWTNDPWPWDYRKEREV